MLHLVDQLSLSNQTIMTWLAGKIIACVNIGVLLFAFTLDTRTVLRLYIRLLIMLICAYQVYSFQKGMQGTRTG